MREFVIAQVAPAAILNVSLAALWLARTFVSAASHRIECSFESMERSACRFHVRM